MIRIYGMPSCPDCEYVKRQAEGNDRYEIIDIGKDVKALKEFLRTVTLQPEDAGLESGQVQSGAACSLDGSGC